MQRDEKKLKTGWMDGAGRRVHFMGICGVGMAGVAFLLKRCGWCVSGCDAKPDSALKAWLEKDGIPVAAEHNPCHVTDGSPDSVVVTPAVSTQAPERKAATAQHIPVTPRGVVLAELMSKARGVAVCGSHGKTTTSCFTTRLLQELGTKPSWCIGGCTRGLGGVAGTEEQTLFKNGKRPLLVAESDESDGTLALYHPAVTVINTLDPDHLDHFKNEGELITCFRSVASQTAEGVAVCCDSPRAVAAAQARAAGVPLLPFGVGEQAELRATDIEAKVGKLIFRVQWRGKDYGSIALPFGGKHNALNALGAAAAALLLGYKPEAIFAALPKAGSELPGRRFEAIATINGTRIIADYAHHPAELRAAVEMALEEKPNRLIVVFQPHRYSRTLALGDQFPAAFKGADEIILLPVYAASEAPLEGGEICDLYAKFREQATVPRLMLARTVAEVWAYLRERLRPGGIVLLAGAGDIINMTQLIRRDAGAVPKLEAFRLPAFKSLAKSNFFGCGGEARWAAGAENEQKLAALLQECSAQNVPWRVLGAGANSWISDLGEPGCVIEMKGSVKDLKWEVPEHVLAVSAGMSGAALLDWCEAEGWSGLEFLDSVPGTVGGWLAMNAGAHGGEFSNRVAWIRCLNPEGKISILSFSECGFDYRSCAALAPRNGKQPIALACGVRLEKAMPAEIRAKRMAVRAKRMPLAGLRTEGSVFKNPSPLFAGKLLEEAGCKGLRIGGARVTDFHANVIAVESGVTASDILALTMKMRANVERKSGVRLEPEITGLSI